MLAVVGAGSTVVDVERALGAHDAVLVRPVVLHLLWHGALTTDLSRPLGGLSVVSRAR